MKIYLLEYVKPFERYAFTSPYKAKKHFADKVMQDCDALDRQQMQLMEILSGQSLEEIITSKSIEEFNEAFGSDCALIVELDVIK